MREQLQQLREHPWLGHALLGIVAILMLYGILVLRDANMAAARRIDRLQANIERMSEIADETIWKQRLQAARTRLGQLQSRLWQAPTPSLAQARVQDRINLLLRRFKIDTPRLQVGTLSPVERAPAAAIQSKLDFRFDAQTLTPFLAALLGNDPPFHVHALTFRDRDNTRVSMTIIAYFRRPESS